MSGGEMCWSQAVPSENCARKHAVTFWCLNSPQLSFHPGTRSCLETGLSHLFVSGSRDAASEPRRLETTYESRPSAPFHACGNVGDSKISCTQSVSSIGHDRKAQVRRCWPRNWQHCPNLGSRECQRLASPNVHVVELEAPLLRGRRERQDTFSKTRVHANHPAIVFVTALPHVHTALNSNASHDS
jgi:hypothetical protein